MKNKTAEQFAQDYYQLETSCITSVTIKSAIKFAERYASQFTGAWISVNDAVPNDRQTVIVCSKDGVVKTDWWLGQKEGQSESMTGFQTTTNVILWQPFPKAPTPHLP